MRLGFEAGNGAGAVEFADGIMEIRTIGFVSFEHDVKDACELVRHRGDFRGPAEFGAEAAVVFAQFVLGVVQHLRDHAQSSAFSFLLVGFSS